MTVPSLRASVAAKCSGLVVPGVTSTTRSAISPPVSARTRAAASSRSATIVASAPVASEAQNDDQRRARFARADHAAQTVLARADDDDAPTGRKLPDLTNPANSVRDRDEEWAGFRRDVFRDRIDERVRVQVLDFRITSPQRGRDIDPRVSVAQRVVRRQRIGTVAQAIVSRPAHRARPAGDELLDSDPRSDADVPTPRRLFPNRQNTPDVLVALHARRTATQPRIERKVASADAGRLDREQSVIVADVRERKTPQLDAFQPDRNGRQHLFHRGLTQSVKSSCDIRVKHASSSASRRISVPCSRSRISRVGPAVVRSSVISTVANSLRKIILTR